MLATAAAALIAIATPASALEHRYTVRVDEDLARLSVEASFAGPVERVEARSGRAGNFLVDARRCGSEADLRPRGRRLDLGRGGIDCLEYTVDLEAAARSARGVWRLSEDALVAEPAYWLWHPALVADDRLVVSFEMPGSMQVALPWPRAGHEDTFLLGSSPQSGRATAVFGRFEERLTTLGETELSIRFLDDVEDQRATSLTEWVRSTAGNVGLVYGRLPDREVSVFLLPSPARGGGDSSAVPFGRVVRDGGVSIELWIDPAQPVEALYAEWTPTHEFAHLMLPYLERSQRWISEGFASYYQNVLLARSGQYSEEQAWQKLTDGFARGRDSVPSLSPNAAAATGERNTRMKVYWSGAAIALLADVDLRRRSGGRESLDTLLARLADCCLPSDQAWSGPELFTTLDSFLDAPLFMPLYERWANRPGFPEVDAVLRELGVTGTRAGENAPLATVRRAIMAGSDR